MSVIKIAYYYPGFHFDRQMFGHIAESWTEWELIKRRLPVFRDHYQPRHPLWGYEDESIPEVMRNKLEVASSYNISSFLFISYWYQGKEMCMKPLKLALDLASREDCTKPSIMWANHNKYYAYPEVGTTPSRLQFRVDCSNYGVRKMLNRWLDRYISHKNYFCLPDGSRFFSIYSPQSFINEAGDPKKLTQFVQYLREISFQKYNIKLHIHANEVRFMKDMTSLRDFDSCSDYLALGYSENKVAKEPFVPVVSFYGQLKVPQTNIELHRSIEKIYKVMSDLSPISYYPVVSVGRDCSSRVSTYQIPRLGHYSPRPILENFSPKSFRERLDLAIQYLKEQKLAPQIMFLNAWNEWSEGAYLEPDLLHQYSLLKEIKDSSK